VELLCHYRTVGHVSERLSVMSPVYTGDKGEGEKLLKRIWILGAGTSVALGSPLGLGVLENINQYIEMIQKTDETKVEEAKFLWKRLLRAIAILYGERQLSEIDFEDFISRLRLLADGNFQDGIKLKQIIDEDHPSIIELFTNKIKYELNGNLGIALSLIDSFYRVFYWYGLMARNRFALAVQKRGRLLKNERGMFDFCRALKPAEDIVVNFNQDIYMEFFLQGHSQGGPVDKPFVNTMYSYSLNQIDDTSVLTILRPHGSFNWIMVKHHVANADPKNYKLITELNDQYGVYEVYRISADQFNVKIPTRCFMMSPDIYKGLAGIQSGDEQIFNEIYDACLKLLNGLGSDDKIIIAGFSGRPTDYLAKMLLDVSLRNKKREQIIVVNPSCKIEGVKACAPEYIHVRKKFNEWVLSGDFKKIFN
jgi:hypothetical protein